MRKIKEVLDVVQSVITIVAVVVGGFWTYILFVKERHDYPHLNLEHVVSHITLPKHMTLLRIGVKVENAGQVRAVTSEIVTRVQQILPIVHCEQSQNCMDADLDKDIRNIDSDFDRLPWPLLVKRVSSDKREIEPSEKELLDFEFVIPDYVKEVRVYSFIRNDDKSSSKERIGWAISSYYELGSIREEEKK